MIGSSENQTNGVEGRTPIAPITLHCLQSSENCIVGVASRSGIGRNGNVLIVPTPIPSSLAYCDSRFSLGRKSSYDSDYDFDYDHVASENQPLVPTAPSSQRSDEGSTISYHRSPDEYKSVESMLLCSELNRWEQSSRYS